MRSGLEGPPSGSLPPPSQTVSVLPARLRLGLFLAFDRIEQHQGLWMGYSTTESDPLELGATSEFFCIPLQSLVGRIAGRKGAESASCGFADGQTLNAVYVLDTPAFCDQRQFLLPRAPLAQGLICVLDCRTDRAEPLAWGLSLRLEGEALHVKPA